MTRRYPTLILTAFAAALALSSCEQKGEQEDLASAQDCLDSVSQSDPAAAKACLGLVQGYDSAQANVLKCSIYMTAGGLMENRIVAAYGALKNSSDTNKEATFMALLSLNLPDLNTAYADAQTGNAYCQAAGSKSLAFVGAAVVAGTLLTKLVRDATGTPMNVNDPASAEAAVKSMLQSCTQTVGAAPACSADAASLGATAVVLTNAYCGTASADQDVCGKINSAVAAANGDDARVGQALFCYLHGQTYVPLTNTCANN